MTSSSWVTAVIAVVLLIIGGFATIRLARRNPKLTFPEKPAASPAAKGLARPHEAEDSRDAFRLAELREQTNVYAEQARGYRKLANLFLITQYVLGAGLATTFVQTNVDPQLIGFLGVIVVVASAVANQIKPGDKSVKLQLAVLKLRSMISWAEDQILKLDENAPGAISKYDIRERIRNTFREVEENILRTGLT